MFAVSAYYGSRDGTRTRNMRLMRTPSYLCFTLGYNAGLKAQRIYYRTSRAKLLATLATTFLWASTIMVSPVEGFRASCAGTDFASKETSASLNFSPEDRYLRITTSIACITERASTIRTPLSAATSRTKLGVVINLIPFFLRTFVHCVFIIP